MPTPHFSDVFKRDNHRCVYCGRDLLQDFESFMLAQEDHLIPTKQNGNTNSDNLVIACYLCNKLKGSFVPEMSLTEANRTRYIDAVRDEIMKRRSKYMRDFASWIHEEPGAELPTS